jgi:hypothetical protein
MLRLYAQCASADFPAGALTVLAINLDAASAPTPAFDGAHGRAEWYLMSADDLQAPVANLNGKPLTVAADGTLPPLAAGPAPPSLPPRSCAFVVFPDAHAAACK